MITVAPSWKLEKHSINFRGGHISLNQPNLLTSLLHLHSAMPQGTQTDRQTDRMNERHTDKRVWRGSAIKAPPVRKLMSLFGRSRNTTREKRHLQVC